MCSLIKITHKYKVLIKMLVHYFSSIKKSDFPTIKDQITTTLFKKS